MNAKKDDAELDDSWLRQAVVLGGEEGKGSYKKAYAGALLLTHQYRMHPSIAAFSSKQYYNGLLRSPKSLSVQRGAGGALLRSVVSSEYHDSGYSFGNVAFIDIGDDALEERSSADGAKRAADSLDSLATSYKNLEEARICVELIKKLTGPLGEGALECESIGVITPYNAQRALLKQMLAESDIENVEVNTVDSYQGREKKAIVFSCVRANRRKADIGFLRDGRRMNVALTRAKECLFVVGSMSTLKRAGGDWKSFVQMVSNPVVTDSFQNNF